MLIDTTALASSIQTLRDQAVASIHEAEKVHALLSGRPASTSLLPATRHIDHFHADIEEAFDQAKALILSIEQLSIALGHNAPLKPTQYEDGDPALTADLPSRKAD